MTVQSGSASSQLRRAEARVAVVVLTWNGRAQTLDCLSSLRGVRWPQLQVIVVDNDSIDGTARAIAAEFPEVDIVQTASNLGFAGGSNLGIARAMDCRADWVFVLNNDTTVAPNAIEEMMRSADLPAVGVLTPLITLDSPSGHVWYAGARFDPRRGHSGKMLHYREPVPTDLSGPHPTDRATGAAMMISRRAIEQTGGFDESLFFLYEDVDWSLRIRAAGFTILFVPDARVCHVVAASQAGKEVTPLTSYYGIRNNLAVCRRHAPFSALAEARRELVCLAIHLWAVRRADDRLRSLRAVLRGWRDFRRGRLGPAPGQFAA